MFSKHRKTQRKTRGKQELDQRKPRRKQRENRKNREKPERNPRAPRFSWALRIGVRSKLEITPAVSSPAPLPTSIPHLENAACSCVSAIRPAGRGGWRLSLAFEPECAGAQLEAQLAVEILDARSLLLVIFSGGLARKLLHEQFSHRPPHLLRRELCLGLHRLVDNLL